VLRHYAQFGRHFNQRQLDAQFIALAREPRQPNVRSATIPRITQASRLAARAASGSELRLQVPGSHGTRQVGRAYCSSLGSRAVNTEPLPGSLVTVTSPPIMRASLRLMARPRPDSVRDKQPIHRLRAHSKTWRAAGCSWRSKYSGWKAKKFPCLKPKNNGIAHAGDCNHFDRRARNRLRSPLVGVSPKPLTTTTATSVLIADSPTLSFHASGASFTVPKSPSELTAIRLVAESASLVPANRRPTPKVAHRRGFSLEALAAN
jgi:hypothetical protein